MENIGAPTAGMTSSSGQDIPKVILGFFVNPFLCSLFVFTIFSDYSIGFMFLPR
jgi:choline-glycine betaine transporter